MDTDPALVSTPSNSLELLENLSSIPQELSTLLVSIRRHLHQNPEVGLQEEETARYIRDVLEMHGLQVQGPLAGTGLFVDIEGGRPGPHIGFRADIDALPIQDGKSVTYASQKDGVAHLCGHDAHTAIGLGVALLLSRLRETLQGTVRVFFQPNEEGIPSGAPLMIRDGVLDGLQAVYAYHVDPTLPVGTFGLINGPATAAADRFMVTVKAATTGHSGRPHESVDTIWVATQIMNMLYQHVGRLNDARNAAVLTICKIDGGQAFNVIPDHVAFGGTLRCTHEKDRAVLRDYIIKTAGHVAALYNAQSEVDFNYGAPAVENDPRLIANARETLQHDLGEHTVFEIPRPSMGAEDFAHYLGHIPGALIRVGTSSGPSTSHPLHNALFDIDELSLPIAAKVMTMVLLRHLTENILA